MDAAALSNDVGGHVLQQGRHRHGIKVRRLAQSSCHAHNACARQIQGIIPAVSPCQLTCRSPQQGELSHNGQRKTEQT